MIMDLPFEMPDSLEGIMYQQQATDLLMSVSTEAQNNGEIKVSSIQGLSNIRHLANGKYALPDNTVNLLEGLIRKAKKIGNVDVSLKNNDPKYLNSFLD
jgi:hypothetical protein